MTEFSADNLDWEKVDGLIPAVIQDAVSGVVLMLGYMNQEALQATIGTQKVTFYSRTKQALWVKGETSGNYLNLVAISTDCDHDSLFVLVNPEGPCCHTGQSTCFDSSSRGQWSVLFQIESLIQSRVQDSDPDSYTVQLVEQGLNKIAQKVGEESVEVVIAALQESNERLLNEGSDLLYHLLMLLYVKKLSISDVFGVLNSRLK